MDANILGATRLMRLFNEQVETMAKLGGSAGHRLAVPRYDDWTNRACRWSKIRWVGPAGKSVMSVWNACLGRDFMFVRSSVAFAVIAGFDEVNP